MSLIDNYLNSIDEDMFLFSLFQVLQTRCLNQSFHVKHYLKCWWKEARKWIWLAGRWRFLAWHLAENSSSFELIIGQFYQHSGGCFTSILLILWYSVHPIKEKIVLWRRCSTVLWRGQNFHPLRWNITLKVNLPRSPENEEREQLHMVFTFLKTKGV